MGWPRRFSRRTKIAPGVSLNWSRSGPSVSVGPHGPKLTVGRRGIRRSIGNPGTGLFAANQQSLDSLRGRRIQPCEPESERGTTVSSASRVDATAVMAVHDLERCGFCGGQAEIDGRCGMCGQPVERWRGA
jgi:Protein of unknown function (DUF4236)